MSTMSTMSTQPVMAGFEAPGRRAVVFHQTGADTTPRRLGQDEALAVMRDAFAIVRLVALGALSGPAAASALEALTTIEDRADRVDLTIYGD